MTRLTALTCAALVALAMLAVTVAAKPALGRPPIPQTRITILSRDVPVSRGVARVRLSCQMGEAIRLTCHGALSLHALTGALLGRVRFAIPNCCSAPWHVVALPVSLAGKSLPVRARAQAVLDRNAASGTQAVRLVSSG